MSNGNIKNKQLVVISDFNMKNQRIINVGKSINDNDAINKLELTDAITDIGLPTSGETSVGYPGDKLILNENKDGYILQASTTACGFYEPDDITITYVSGTSTLILTPNDIEYTFVSYNGSRFNKTIDSLNLTLVNGIIYIYYNDDGIMQQYNNPTKEITYELLKTTLPICFLTINTSVDYPLFIGNYLKRRNNNNLYAKNFYDKAIYTLQGLDVFGLTNGDGNDDSDARFGLAEGYLLFTDEKYYSPLRETTDNWNVGYLNGSNLMGISNNQFPVLTDIDLGIGTTGRLTYNNNGSPSVVSNGDYVWYFIGISNSITQSDRTFSFMGNNEYSRINAATNSLYDEIAAVESNMIITQGITLQYAVLYDTQNNMSNSVRGNIVDFQTIAYDGTTTSATSVSVPDELISGTDASSYHNHESLYMGINTTIDEISGITLTNPINGQSIIYSGGTLINTDIDISDLVLSGEIISGETWDGTQYDIDLSSKSLYTLVVNDTVTSITFGLNFSTDSNTRFREIIVRVDNTNNSSAISNISFTGGTWKWSVGDPISGIPSGGELELLVRNISNTTVKAITDLES